MSLSRSELDERGYEGFVSFTDLRSGAPSEVPPDRGQLCGADRRDQARVHRGKPRRLLQGQGPERQDQCIAREVGSWCVGRLHRQGREYAASAQRVLPLRRRCSDWSTGAAATFGRSPGATTGSSAGRPARTTRLLSRQRRRYLTSLEMLTADASLSRTCGSRKRHWPPRWQLSRESPAATTDLTHPAAEPKHGEKPEDRARRAKVRGRSPLLGPRS